MNFTLDVQATRLSAVDDGGHEICGAFLRQNHWTLFMDSVFFEPFGVAPVVEHLPVFTRAQALNLVHVLAMAWLAKASETEQAA